MSSILERDRVRKREARYKATDIGDPPPVKNQRRRTRCKKSLLAFLKTYFDKSTFYMAFGPYHLQLIEKIEDCVFNGGKIVIAMPRGSGKTTILQRAIIWATLNGHSRFAMLIAADDIKAKQLANGLRTILQTNQKLLDDYPEVIDPIMKASASPQRAMYQRCHGKRTNLHFSKSAGIMFPDTDWTRKRKNSQATIVSGGLESSAVRGAVVTLPTGENLRPDLVLVDDPQTRASAVSETQCSTRENIMKADIAHTRGGKKKMALCVTLTCIVPDDLASRLMDKKRSPDWEQHRVKKLITFPDDTKLWDDYYNLFLQETYGEADEGAANQFYRDNQEVMDKGAEHYWPERIELGRVTAIQSAMHEYLHNPTSFMSESQNEPEELKKGDLDTLSSIQLVRRRNPTKRGVVPDKCEYLVAHVDVQLRVLYWMVCGVTRSLGASIVDWGTYPKQRSINFEYAELAKRPRRTLQGQSPGNDENGAIKEGIIHLVRELSEQQWERQDGATMVLDRGLIDGGYKVDTVEAAVLHSRVPNWYVTRGVGIGAKSSPLKLRDKSRGRRGINWIIQKAPERLSRGVYFDTNFWKSETYAGLRLPETHTDAIRFPLEEYSKLQMVADHFTSEVATRVTSNGRSVDEWDLIPSRDNHYWDNLVGCLVCASICGARKGTHQHAIGRKRIMRARHAEAGWE